MVIILPLVIYSLAFVTSAHGKNCEKEVFYDKPFKGPRKEDVFFSTDIKKGYVIHGICVKVQKVHKIVATYTFQYGHKEDVTTRVPDYTSGRQRVCLTEFSEQGVVKLQITFFLKGKRLQVSDLTIILCKGDSQVPEPPLQMLQFRCMVLDQEINNLRNKLKNAAEFIGFAARMTENVQAPQGAVVPFNQVDVNVPPGSYNSISGAFTCPVSGYYFFSLAAFSQGDTNNIQLSLKRVGQNEVNFVGAFADKEHWDQGSAQYVIQCNAGDNVFCQQVNSGWIIAEAKGGYVNAFSGFLVTPT